MSFIRLAEEAKREKKFDLAIEYYEKQLVEEGVTSEQLQSIAKVYYLKRQNSIALMFHLAAAHLSLYLDFQKYKSEDERIKVALEQTPSELRNHFPHPIGDLLFHYGNLPKHIGHAFLDHDGTYEKDSKFKKYAEIYYAQILGDGSQGKKFEAYQLIPEQLHEIENKRYKPAGYQVLLERLQWSEIDNSNVIELYMKQD